MDDGEVGEEGDAEAAGEGCTGLLRTFVEGGGDAAGGFEACFLASEGGGEDERTHEGDEIVCV